MNKISQKRITTEQTTRTMVSAGLLVAAAILGLGWAPSVWAQTPPSCNQGLTTGCLYFPGVWYATEPSESEVSYTDIAGLPRTVRMAIRRPIGAPAPMPVVIWSHGGAEGSTASAHSLSEWSETTAQAGYLTISLAHPPRPDEELDRMPLCQAIAAAVPGARWDLADPLTCRVFKHLNWDRPHDIRAVLEELPLRNAQGPFRGLIDLNRIAVGGHSAGAGGALTVGGALRNFTGTPVDLSDPDRRPIAFIALSPRGPAARDSSTPTSDSPSIPGCASPAPF